MSFSAFRLLYAIREFLRGLFNLHDDKEREETTIAEVKKNVVFKGANLWILIFAILIASIGLNVNSTAVVIGAMLISPLMGPIMGIGLGAGINDLPLIKTSFKNLAVAVSISVITSALYFWITPLQEAQSELLARTTPTLWDVLIALFGGLAGIIAGSRKEKSNAIPGVAIATALMPPLCTAGYGIANGNLYYFLGAFYLFFINSVLISVSTFIIVRVLKYRKVHYENESNDRKVSTYITLFVLLTIVPSTYLAYNLVSRTIFEQNARSYISSEFLFQDTQVIQQRFVQDAETPEIEITLYGRVLSDERIEELISRRVLYKLSDAKVRIRQGYQDHSETASVVQEFQKMGDNIKMGIIEDLYLRNERILVEKNKQIAALEQRIKQAQPSNYPAQDILKEMVIQYPNVLSLHIGDMVSHQYDTVCHAFINFSKMPPAKERKKIEEWLQIRLKQDSLRVVIQ